MGFDESERAQVPMYIITENKISSTWKLNSFLYDWLAPDLPGLDHSVYINSDYLPARAFRK